MASISFRDFKITYGSKYRLSIDGDLRSGVIWQVTGENGIGKTSVVRQLLFGQIGWKASVTLNGAPVSQLANGLLNYGVLYRDRKVS